MPSMRVASSAAAQPLARLVARRAARDDLGQHRIVERRHLGAARDPGLDACAVGRKDDVGQQAGAGLELRAADPRRRGAPGSTRPCGVRRQRVERRQLARRQAHHPLDEIDAGDLLGDAVLDLQARVDLEEVERRRRRRRARTRPCRPSGSAPARPSAAAAPASASRDARRQVGRRRLLDHLLVAPLQRAVALAEREHAARAVAEDLHLDVAGAHDEASRDRARRA